jgi:hypothetical protein
MFIIPKGIYLNPKVKIRLGKLEEKQPQQRIVQTARKIKTG